MLNEKSGHKILFATELTDMSFPQLLIILDSGFEKIKGKLGLSGIYQGKLDLKGKYQGKLWLTCTTYQGKLGITCT